MSNSHKGSNLSLQGKIIPVDNNTVFLAHYDIATNDVLYGIEPISNISTLRDGYYGGGVAIEESTTNLWTGGLNTYNNYQQSELSSSLVALNETYMGQTIYRLTMTPLSANALTSMQNDMWSHGVYGSYMTYQSGNAYTSSIYWRAFKGDIAVGGTASNVAGWSDVGTYVQNDRWNRSISKWYDTTNRSDNKFWSFRSPSAVANETIVVDWVAPQIEQKTFTTSYINGARANGNIVYPNNGILNPKEGCINVWVNVRNDLPAYAWRMIFVVKDNGYTDGTETNQIRFGFVSNWNTWHWKFEGSGGSAFYQTQTVTSGWHMFTCNWSVSNGFIKYYYDGNLKYTGVDTSNIPSNFYNYFYLGNWTGGGSNPSNHIIDELRIDRVAKSDEEVMSWYISNQPFYPKGIYRLAY